MNVEVFELGRGGKDDVGVIRGVGLELLMNDREQIITTQSFEDVGLVGGDGGRVAVINVEGLDGGAGQCAAEGLAKLVHIDGAGAWGREVGPHDPGVEIISAAG